LNERIYDISADVDFIYNNSFKPFIDDFQNDKVISNINDYSNVSLADKEEFKEINLSSKDFLFSVLDSGDLKSKDCKKADSKLPLKIYCGIFKAGSFHVFDYWNSNPYIGISLNASLYEFLLSYRNIGKSPIENMDGKLKIRAKNEFTERRIKSAISHELSHWIDNAVHDIFRNIVGNETTPEGKNKALKLHKKSHVNTTYFEIQGQIHSIIEYKRSFKEKWDLITWDELFNLLSSLYVIAENIKKENGVSVLKNWFINLFHRMDRENLVGRKMRDQLRNNTVKNILSDILNPNSNYDIVN